MVNNLVSRYGPVSVTYFKANRKFLDHISKYQHPKEDCTLELSQGDTIVKRYILIVTLWSAALYVLIGHVGKIKAEETMLELATEICSRHKIMISQPFANVMNTFYFPKQMQMAVHHTNTRRPSRQFHRNLKQDVVLTAANLVL
jgi:hypothetical protein